MQYIIGVLMLAIGSVSLSGEEEVLLVFCSTIVLFGLYMILSDLVVSNLSTGVKEFKRRSSIYLLLELSILKSYIDYCYFLKLLINNLVSLVFVLLNLLLFIKA